jgi:hypothetical protein
MDDERTSERSILMHAYKIIGSHGLQQVVFYMCMVIFNKKNIVMVFMI